MILFSGSVISFLLMFQGAVTPPMPQLSVTATYMGQHLTQTGTTKAIPPTILYAYRGYDFTLHISISMPKGMDFQPSHYALYYLWPGGGRYVNGFDSTMVQRTSDTTFSLSSVHWADGATDLEVFLLWRDDLRTVPREELRKWPNLDAPFLHSSNRAKVHLSVPDAIETR